MLRSRNPEEAEKAALREPRACSVNLLLTQPPGVVRTLEPEDGALVHANPFPEPPMQGGGFDREGSVTRHLSRHLSGNCYTLDDVQNGLRDRKNAPDAVCRHPDLDAPDDARYATVVSAVMDLLGRVLYIFDGSPDTAPYRRVALAPMVGHA